MRRVSDFALARPVRWAFAELTEIYQVDEMISRAGGMPAKFPLDTFLKAHWPRARTPGRFGPSDPYAPGKAGPAECIAKNHGSSENRPSWRLAGGSEIRV